MIRYIFIFCSLAMISGCAMETTSEADLEAEEYIYQEGHVQGYDFVKQEPTDDVTIYSDFLLSRPAGVVGTGDKVLLVKRVRQAVYVESTDGISGWISVRNVQEMDEMFPEEILGEPGNHESPPRRGR